MRKFAIGLVAIIVILLFLPLIVGRIIRHQIYSLQDIPHLAYHTTVKVTDYHAGWFHSRANLTVTIRSNPLWGYAMTKSLGEKFPTSLSFDVRLNIIHGPLVYLHHNIAFKKQWLWGRGVAMGTIKIAPPLVKSLAYFPWLKKGSAITAWLRLNGSVTLAVNDKPGLVFSNNKRKIAMAFNHYREITTLSSQFNHIISDINAKGMAIKNQYGGIDIPSTTGHIDFTLGKAGLWYGHYTIDMPSITVINKKHDGHSLIIKLQKMQFEAKRQLQTNNNLVFNNTVTVNKITANSKTIGPFKVDMSSSNIRPQAVINLQAALGQLTQHHAKTLPLLAKTSLSHHERVKKIFNLIQPKLVEMLTGTTFVLNTLQLQTPDGLLSMEGRFLFPVQITGAVDNPRALQLLFNVASGKLHIVAPQSLLKKLLNSIEFSRLAPGPVLPKQEKSSQEAVKLPQHAISVTGDTVILPMLVKQKIIIPQGKNYIASIVYNNQQLTVNGQNLTKLSQANTVKTPTLPTALSKASQHKKQ